MEKPPRQSDRKNWQLWFYMNKVVQEVGKRTLKTKNLVRFLMQLLSLERKVKKNNCKESFSKHLTASLLAIFKVLAVQELNCYI